MACVPVLLGPALDPAVVPLLSRRQQGLHRSPELLALCTFSLPTTSTSTSTMAIFTATIASLTRALVSASRSVPCTGSCRPNTLVPYALVVRELRDDLCRCDAEDLSAGVSQLVHHLNTPRAKALGERRDGASSSEQ